MFDILPILENQFTAYSESFRILASDVQNFNTDGNKQARYTFVQLFSQELVKVGGGSSLVPGSPNTQSISQGVALYPMGYDFSQGGLREGKPLNAAVSGTKGLFVLKPGNASHYIYSRASEWVMAPDGTLVDVFGRKVMGYKRVNGVTDTSQLVPIVIDTSEISPDDIGFEDGGILVQNYQARKSAREDADQSVLPEGEGLYQLALADIPNQSALSGETGNAFKTNTASGEPSMFGISGEGILGNVRGGHVESSNVDPAETTIIGIQLQRGYNLSQAVLGLITKTLTSFMSAIEKA